MKSFPSVDWLIGGLLLWMFLACCYPIYDTDLFWHLKTGEWIISNWSIPGYDLYTYTDWDKRWIDLHWGFQVGAAIVYKLGGANLLILVKAGIITLALGIGCHAGGAGLRPWQRVLCWLPAAIVVSGRGYERPEIISLVCLATWLWILTRVERQPRLLWVLPVLQVFWINCHALFILGLVVGCCFAIDFGLRWLARGRFLLAPLSPQLTARLLLSAAALCGLAAFVNPYLEEGALFPFVLFRKFTIEQAFYSTHIGEFQMPITFLRKYGLRNLYLNSELLLWMLACGSFIWLALRRRISVFRVLIFTGFSYLAWKASRNSNIFAIVAGYVLAENLAEIIRCSPVSADVGPGNRPVRQSPPKTKLADAGSVRHVAGISDGHALEPSKLDANMERVVGISLLLLIAAVVTGEWNHWAEKNKPFRLGEAKHWYVHDAAKFMRQPGFPTHVYGSIFGVASVYSYYNFPPGKVFMDGRLEVCTQDTFEKFDTIQKLMSSLNPAWVGMIRESDGSYPALMLDTRDSREMIRGALATPGWRLVFADKSCAVFFDESTADRLQLPMANPEPLVVPPEY